MKKNYKKKLTILLKALECKKIESLVEDGDLETFECIGSEIKKAARLGASFHHAQLRRLRTG